jgi:hypothetical protein
MFFIIHIAMIPFSIFHLQYSNRGQSLVEVLVAIGVFMTAIGAVTSLFYGGQGIAIDARNAADAVEYAQEGGEAVRSIRNRDWSLLTDGSHGLVYSSGNWQFQGTSDTRDFFTRRVDIATLDTNTKIATTTATWSTNPLRAQTAVVVEKLHRFDNPAQGVCKIGPLSGNWSNPQTLGSADLGAGVSGTDVVVKLPYVFMSGVSSTAAKPDIFVFDVSNPALPQLRASLDIGGGGINSLFLKGNYLYAASPNNSKELIIFDVSVPANITEVGSKDLSGSADAYGIYVFSNTAAVGRDQAATNELAFLNVSTPSSPAILAEASTGGSIRDFAASGDRLYFVSQESDSDVWAYSITDPLNPTFATHYDIPGTTEDISIFIQEGQSGAPVANILVGNIQDELIVIGATTTQSTGWYVRDRINLGGDVNDIICVENNLAFLATSNSNKEFLIVDISNPDNIFEKSSLNFPQMGTGIDFADNKVFMSVRSNDSLRIITSGP